MSRKFTLEEVKKASLEYFKGDELAADVFATKYSLCDSGGNHYELTPADSFLRHAKELHRIEMNYKNPLSYEEILDMLNNWEFVLQGGPFSGIGNPHQVQSLSNCFVVPSPLDSYSGIFYTDQQQVQIMKRRGGVGHDISNIRPKGLSTTNAAKTTDGIGCFMERWSSSTREVAQGGRRGALMMTISVHHPEIMTFIKIKKDRSKVTGANISIRCTDEFMKAVEKGETYQLRFPVDAKKPKIEEWVDAKTIWKEIMQSAWDSAEPGVLFWDTIIDGSPADCYADVGYKTISTNPCQPAWATVLTEYGISTMGKVQVGDEIWSGQQWTKIINKVETGVKQVFAYHTRAGTFYGTENHRVVSNGVKVEAKDAKTIDIAPGVPRSSVWPTDLQAIVDGLVIGDGTVHKASNGLVLLIVGKKDQEWLTSEVSDYFLRDRSGIGDGYWTVKTTVNTLPKTYDRKVPDKYKFGIPNKVRSFLRGLYSANGSVAGNRITLKASSFDIIKDVQQMLSILGVSSYYTTNKAHDVTFKNGTYTCKQSYDLNIGTNVSKKIFVDLIGFIQSDKQAKALTAIGEKRRENNKISYEIVSKELISEEAVYDITVDAPEHTYWTGGMLVSNCSELPLSALDSCRLSFVNLVKFVQNPYMENAKFDFNKFEEVSYKSQKLMDDLVDLELEAIDKIINKVKTDPEPDYVKKVELDLWTDIRVTAANGRRTGLGITGLGDALAMLGIKYGSDESIKMAGRIYKSLGLSSYKSSVDMAESRGSFNAFDLKKEKDHPFVKRLLAQDEELYKKYTKVGRRNIANLTTAPVGSLSTLTQTTSGIEPAIFLNYKRRRKVPPTEKHDFIDNSGDCWQEYEVYHHGVKWWMEHTQQTDIKKSPYYKATAEDIDWEKKVELQAAAQKWIDHAISNTTNLPQSATTKDVEKVYMLAWKSGCKGATVYRAGSRTGVLINSEAEVVVNDRNKVSIVDTIAPKRPPFLECDIHRAKIKGQEHLVIISLLDKKPYEIFAGISERMEFSKKDLKGKLEKLPKKTGGATYNLIVGEMTFKDIVNLFDNPNHGALTRMISTGMRHGVPVKYIVEQLRKDKYSDISSFSRVMARILGKSYIPDGTESTEKTCSQCGSDELAYQEGCVACLQCGYSKCS